MESSRRKFLTIAGASVFGMGAGPVLNTFASSGEQSIAQVEEKKSVATHENVNPPLQGTHWGMVIDTRKIESAEQLEPIINACNKAHNIPFFQNLRHEIKWIWEEAYHNAFPTKANKYLNERLEDLPFLVLCNHCENPPCCRACPTEATFKRKKDGIVMMDFHRCIGCRFCMAACPYGSRSFNFRDPRKFIPDENYNPHFPRRSKGVVEKCNFCAERLAKGLMPACVEASDGIISFGDLDDPDSHVRELLKHNYTIRRKQNLGTGPSIYYIV